jgi:hypothetical protein
VAVDLNHTYSFFALAKDNVGNLELSRPVPVTIRITSGVDDRNADEYFLLHEVYPNPTENKVYFDYALSRNGHTTLLVMDAIGNTIASLIHGYMREGFYAQELDCKSLASGTYYVRLEQGGRVRTKKFVVVR